MRHDSISRIRYQRSADTEPARRLAPKAERRRPRAAALDYRLVVLTNGRPCLRETLEAFRRLASPTPAEVLIVDDGASAITPYGGGTDWHAVPTMTLRMPEARGFCGATAEAWRVASVCELTEAGPLEWVFWLEDDFVLNRPLDLTELAGVMDAEPQLAQMALYRNPYSGEEIAAGGYLNLPGRDYEPRETIARPWFEHDHYWTTNPSLFRRELAEQHAWPDEPECEGRFGICLLEQRPETRFGVWGAGAPWVEHVAERVGFGY